MWSPSFALSLLLTQAASAQQQQQLEISPLGTPTITATGIASSTSGAVVAPVAQPIDIDAPVVGPLNATAWALIYTYPVYIFANFAGSVFRRNVAANQIYHERALASPAAPGVIKPNIDTLYSRVVLDLGRGDVVLNVPNITNGQYWNYPIYDFFGNDVAEIGNINKSPPGEYLIRRAEDVYGTTGIYAPSSDSPYVAVVNLPTTYATMLLRLFVASNTTDTLQQLHTYQNATTIRSVPRRATVGATPEGNLTSYAPNQSVLGIDSPAKLLDFAARLLPFNQPIEPRERARVAGILGQAGVYDGAYTAQSGVNLTQASEIANSSISADIGNSTRVRNLGNGWQLSVPEYQGNYSNHYAPRAYVAVAGYQQTTVHQTLYPGYQSTGFTSQVTLEPNTSLLFTFSGKPLLKPTGFWSLSVYGEDQFLIPNSLGRFEIGDRSFNLTYQDNGAQVYGPEANATADGPFQVLAQPVDAAPPANWTGNWLPTSTTFSFLVRWYVPQDAMTDGSYQYPLVQTIKSIV